MATYKSLPLLRGTLASVDATMRAYLGRPGWRVYPYQLGCYVSADSVGGLVDCHGVGDFQVNDYVLPCAPTYYGASSLLIPDVTRITRVSVVDAVNDQLTLSPVVQLWDDEYLLNLGADGASNPTVQPNYDGSLLALYEDPVGNEVMSYDYIVTGEIGDYHVYLTAGSVKTDLLIQDSQGPRLVIPLVDLGAQVAV